MPKRDPSSSVPAAVLCGAVPPGPLNGLLEVLREMENDPLGSLSIYARELDETARQVVALLREACGDGVECAGRYQPALTQRSEGMGEAAALLAEARTTTTALRKVLDVLVPAITLAASLVELQTESAPPPR